MKKRLKHVGVVSLVVLGFLLSAAHAARWHGPAVALAWLAPVAFLSTGREFVRRAAQIALLAGAAVTVDSMASLIRMRQAMGLPWGRLAAILTLAALVTALAALALEHSIFRKRGKADVGSTALGKALEPLEVSGKPGSAGGGASPWPGLAAWALALFGLGMVQLKVPAPMILAERFLPGAGWLEASLLALYAGFVAEALLAPGRWPVVRRRIWSLFSLVFFGQLALGLAGFHRFLMTGKLHLPVPALIVAGPLFREEGVFMLALFGATVLLLGPAWCSHLCYIGAWDSAMASSRAQPSEAPSFLRRGRMVLAGLVFASAFFMGRLGVETATAAWMAAGFGLAGVAVMAAASRRLGYMAHCTGWCPMGLVSGLLGRFSPWRLRIREGCTSCGSCSRVCRYDALRPEDLAAKRPGVSCSLCGDCLSRCPRSEMELTFFGRSGMFARASFAALAAGLHAVFLGVARL